MGFRRCSGVDTVAGNGVDSPTGFEVVRVFVLALGWSGLKLGRPSNFPRILNYKYGNGLGSWGYGIGTGVETIGVPEKLW